MKKWDAPLPKHTELDYYECYAKIILSHLLSINCESILIRDRPDLQFIDDSRGIEVTQAIDQDQQKQKIFIRIYIQFVVKKEPYKKYTTVVANMKMEF